MPKTRPVDGGRARSSSRDVSPPARPERLAVDVTVHGIRTPVDTPRLTRLARYVLRAERRRDAMISIALVSSRAIAALNTRYLRHKGPTDVIAFAFTPPGTGDAPALGDIYICPAVARKSARAFGVTFGDEIDRLVVHGSLHVLGWDHPPGAERELSPMWRRQESLLRSWRAKGATQ
jgi:probable rRNA maturation factor